ncbi:calcium-translocating P-type ATPase, SERCA-type [Aceticella autotrophica]|uniref:Calcium-translocating P-type ATPase, SERCA-type n=1 Tax=Aceticella autotrophica TaxID=2755338 RepID=A0A975AX48_9THEO|nr:calcium-translocating P-type ATPase, SERCA-type [Aceticella autotrophica]QSZ28003.1 calcium-translocating P-type ATPase, SERCA-type [Aceticella autotrophica]
MFSMQKPKQDTIYYLNDDLNLNGLTEQEAQKRFLKFGPNVLEGSKKITPFEIFLDQFKDFIVMVLLAATLFSALMGEVADALTITIIVILNAILGFIQEYRTEQSLEALKKLAAPTTKVIRNGVQKEISVERVVMDDIIILEAGDRIPADAIIIESHNLEVDESILTGESIPVHKESARVKGRGIKGKQNLIYMGTVVINGRCKAVVKDTGMETEMGKIAGMIKNIDNNETPLQKRLDKLGKILVTGSLIICAAVTILGIIRGESIYYMFLSGVSLAVAAIPEGLPAVVTVSLAIGVQRMLKRNAIIRKLPAVETLGCVNIICTDKTGTLTENKMTVKKIYADNKEIEVKGRGFRGLFSLQDKNINPLNSPVLKRLLEIGAVCNNADVRFKKIKVRREMIDEIECIGDPTEAAILIASIKGGILPKDLSKHITRIEEIPFNSDRKRMSVIVEEGGTNFVFTKGAPDVILDICTMIYMNDKEVPLTSFDKKRILDINAKFGENALRVLAFAYRKIPKGSRSNPESVERDLVFVGLEGMMDPPRREVYDAVLKCKMAGIKPVMITGDHKITASAIAKELNILGKGDSILSGAEMDHMDEKALENICENTTVYARVTPKHKLRIVKALKKRGYTVAMTGDGVNDAPAIKEADIGISMGKEGTDVAKEASSMILTDDNFASIVAAIEEGRMIYDNIRKFIRYLLSCNIGEVITMFLAVLTSLELPLIPIQILMVNLVTDGLPALALGLDPPDKDIMEMKPRGAHESVFSRGLGIRIGIVGFLMALCTLGAYIFSLNYDNLYKARTIAFATLVMIELIHAFECRSERHLIFEIGLFSNIYLVIACLVSFFIFVSTIYVPALSAIFKTTVLTGFDWLVIIFFSSIEFVFNNLYTAFILPSKKVE